MTSSEPPEQADVDAIAAAVSACPLVARLSAGRVGEVATYLPGRRVAGVRVGADAVTVHVVARYGPTMTEVADQVRTAVSALTGGRPVHVGIDDIDVPALMSGPPAP